ncbi:MAG: DNA-binding protein WhiA [Roseburia sp.]
MSFSSEVKEELEKQIGKSRHCQLAELAALFGYCGRLVPGNSGYCFELATEHAGLAKKCYTLIKKAFGFSPELATEGGCVLRISNQEELSRILEALKFKSPDGMLHPLRGPVNGLLLQKSCCMRAFVRGCYLAAGSMSDPNKAYHFEVVCATMEQAMQLRNIMRGYDTDAKIVERKNHYVVYLKEGAQIVDMLNVMEAHVALMNLENVRIIKEMRNSVNRKVNCETANINKTVTAAVRQIEDIVYIRDRIGLEKLPANLKEIAQVRLEYPEAPLKELGELLDPPVGKSGVNHRLRKIGEIADKLRTQRGKEN